VQVQEGDTICAVGICFNRNFREIQEKNPNIIDPDKIYPGQRCFSHLLSRKPFFVPVLCLVFVYFMPVLSLLYACFVFLTQPPFGLQYYVVTFAHCDCSIAYTATYQI
jgi:hypothetical protein